MANPEQPGAPPVLLVEDDSVLAEALERAISEGGYRVIRAGDGKAAQQLLNVEAVAAVVSDIRMPSMNGIELLHWIKKNKPCAVILMTGFSELCEAKEALELGADGFLAKPFEKKELLELLGRHTKRGPAAPDVDVSHQYCKLNIDDFVSGRSIQFEIFIRLSSTKYVKIAHRGDDLPAERIRTFKAKNLKFLYMKKEEFAKYVGFNLALLKAAAASDAISAEKKQNLLKHTGELILSRVRFDGIDEDSYDYAKTFTENAVSILAEDGDAFNLLEILKGHTDFLYVHSVAVSMMSVLIAREMNWTSIANFFKIGLGGLMHDIGKKEIDAAILAKKRKDLTAKEVELIEKHPWRGLEILTQLRAIPGDVIQIAAQHHENCAGQGYPKGLRKSQIHPLARLISTANEFCDLVLNVPNSPELAPKEAVQRLMSFSADKLDLDFLLALARLFKITPNPELVNKKPAGFGGVAWRGKG